MWVISSCPFYVEARGLRHITVNSGRFLFACESSLFQLNVTYLEFSSDFVFVFALGVFPSGSLANQKKKKKKNRGRAQSDWNRV